MDRSTGGFEIDFRITLPLSIRHQSDILSLYEKDGVLLEYTHENCCKGAKENAAAALKLVFLTNKPKQGFLWFFFFWLFETVKSSEFYQRKKRQFEPGTSLIFKEI